MADSLWSPIKGGFTAPAGFLASGVKAGFKKSGKKDLALLVAPESSTCVGTFTQSMVRASCVDLCIERLKNTVGKTRAVLINSGQANACSGVNENLDNINATKALAEYLSFDVEKVLICSTGLIGAPIEMNKLYGSLSNLVENLNKEGGSQAAKAILTTDLVLKELAFEADFDGRKIRIGGIAKGSGMIHPNMATMLAFISCDASVPLHIWTQMVNNALRKSFNAISVDGDTSTNDSLLAFCAGQALDEKYFEELEHGLLLTMQNLAKSIARDGEGANCLIEVTVEGTSESTEAFQIARTICASSLVKSAIHGCDPNWGRIIAAAGRSGVTISQDKINIWLGPYQLISNGLPIDFDRKLASLYIREKINGTYLVDDLVSILLTVGEGKGNGFAWGCDLSDEYIRINADYTT